MKEFFGNVCTIATNHVKDHKEAYFLAVVAASSTLLGDCSWVLFPKPGVLVNGVDIFSTLVLTTRNSLFGATLGETYKLVKANQNTEATPLQEYGSIPSSST